MYIYTQQQAPWFFTCQSISNSLLVDPVESSQYATGIQINPLQHQPD